MKKERKKKRVGHKRIESKMEQTEKFTRTDGRYEDDAKVKEVTGWGRRGEYHLHLLYKALMPTDKL